MLGQNQVTIKDIWPAKIEIYLLGQKYIFRQNRIQNFKNKFFATYTRNLNSEYFCFLLFLHLLLVVKLFKIMRNSKIMMI